MPRNSTEKTSTPFSIIHNTSKYWQFCRKTFNEMKELKKYIVFIHDYFFNSFTETSKALGKA